MWRNYLAILLNSLRCALGYVQQPFCRKLTVDFHAIMMQKGSTSHIHGSSVRCRRHIQPTKIISHLAWAHKSGGKAKPIPSHSSGEGVRGRGASLREAAFPPIRSLTPHIRGGSVSRRGHNHPTGKRTHLAWDAQVRGKKPSLFPATLRERGSGGEALLLEKRPLPRYVPSRRTSAAALSAAVDTTTQQETAPT